MSQPPVILTVGAAGRFAGHVVPAVASRGAIVRALVRTEGEAARAKANGAHEIAFGDLLDPVSLDAAARGADGVFHIGPAFAADETQMGLAMVAAARRAGVRRFVYSSVIQPTYAGLANHACKIPVEEAVYGSGMAYTILHPATFLQNMEPAWPSVVTHGMFAEPFPKTARVARVDYRDVAEVAALALTGDRLAYGTFELCAEGMPNREDIVAAMAEVLGRAVTAAEPDFADWARAANLPYDPDQQQMLARIYRHYAEHGSGGNSLTLAAILGRPPRSLRGFIADLAAGTAGIVPGRS